MASDSRDGYDCGNLRSDYAVAFLTGRELQNLDADPVLDRADYWRGDA